MKIQRLSLIAALALGGLLACSLASAQDNPAPKGKKGGRGPTVEQQMERMTTELTLTDAQKPKVEALLKDTAKKRQELYSDSSVPQDQRREKMRGLMDDQDKELKKILTPEQYTKWEKLREEMRQRKGGPGGPNGEKKGTKAE